MSLPITQHFCIGEFECKDGTPYPAEWIATRLHPLCEVLEVVRAELGNHAITILSGYRTPEHNAAVGGAKASQHVQGRAADITVAGLAPDAVHAKVLELFRTGKIEIGGLGNYDGFTHIDIRPRHPNGRLVMWTG